MTQELLVAGGGIAGLAAALAATRAGWQARLFEQAEVFSEVGAGIQLGPNATRILKAWGVLESVLAVSACPQRLLVRDARDGRELGSLALGDNFERRYGAPYLTIHRADLHAALLNCAREGDAHLHPGARVMAASSLPGAVRAATSSGHEVEADALAVADGVWSSLRAQLLADGPARATGHVAYRALIAPQRVPASLRGNEVTAWLAPRSHLVSYPVRGGDLLNVVGVVEGRAEGDPRDWDHPGPLAALQHAAGPLCPPLEELLRAAAQWRLWALHDREPVSSADQMARGRIALLGDAAHPMRPYLAQGAGMAIEDAFELGRVLAVADGKVIDVETALRRYALNRWQRAARVQRRALRNGRIFHADGLLRRARNLALRAGGERVLDMPWLYSGPV